MPLARLSYADKLTALAKAIEQIAERRRDPFYFHASRDAAARSAREIARSLRGDGL